MQDNSTMFPSHHLIQATSLKTKEGNKHIFRSVRDLSESERGENKGGLTEKRYEEGEYERDHREHETNRGDIKGIKYTPEKNLAERAWHNLIKLWKFSARSTS